MSVPRPQPKVVFRLPAGWFELPPAGAARKGLLRMDPFESLARRMVATGAVGKPLVFHLRDYLRTMAGSAANVVAQASRVEGMSADDLTTAHVAVIGPVNVDRNPDGSPDMDQLAAAAADRRPQETERTVERRDLPWGPAVRAAFERDGRRHVSWWAWSDRVGAGIVVAGSITPAAGRDPEDIVADIDAIAANLEVS